MLRLLLFLRGKLPAGISSRLWRGYWSRYWKREFELEQAEVPGAPELPIAGSERAELIEAIAASWPFRNVLEAGCSYGQNFTILAPLFPGVGFVGVDIDRERLQQGERSLQSRGISNVSLQESRIEDLSQFADDSFDIVYSCALFLYVPPEILDAALSELCRIARKKIILMEQHLEAAQDAEASDRFVQRESGSGGYWLRDYRRAIHRAAAGKNLSLRAIPSPRWPAEHWKQLAHVIEIEM